VKVLVLGGTGMLGHKLWQTLRKRHDTWVTVRAPAASLRRFGDLFDPARTVDGVAADAFATVARALDAVRPAVVVNAIGIIKQDPAATDPVPAITVNALFPHLLAEYCSAAGTRLVHVSTDCVFAGDRGPYAEADRPDAEDLYGRSKLLGEVDRPGCLTLRTSIIGRELEGQYGLVEWFLAQRGSVRGYTHAVFSGLPTALLASTVADILDRFPQLTGLYHVAAAPINKYDLLGLLRKAYDVPVTIEPFDGVRVNRSLNDGRFRSATGFAPPPWTELVRLIAEDPTPYDKWRVSRGP
jgi:dTDP-4-dehydrorhamnose reductase